MRGSQNAPLFGVGNMYPFVEKNVRLIFVTGHHSHNQEIH